MKLTSEYLGSVGFNITDNELGSLHFITAYKAVGELEIKVVFCKTNINLRIWHRQQNERPIINLLDCPTIQKFQLAMQLVDIHPSNCEMENPQKH